jgi:hypothetical protein
MEKRNESVREFKSGGMNHMFPKRRNGKQSTKKARRSHILLNQIRIRALSKKTRPVAVDEDGPVAVADEVVPKVEEKPKVEDVLTAGVGEELEEDEDATGEDPKIQSNRMEIWPTQKFRMSPKNFLLVSRLR